ncbi:hypothetical protein PFI31113_03012 [Pandoraea fibrosis]|uniref:Uncharacterized protein n=1 Tax=Pandoraea fibrosis TaxID=1891094 RepID=A0A5E4W3T0_9BURK|nr:hypothetical protein PFI31113_03012 [Pandoraea fibrosis]
MLRRRADAARLHDNPIPGRSNVSEKFQGEILREFGELIGIPSLTFDDHGTCCFVVDEEHELAILRTGDQLVLTLPISLPEPVMDMPAKHLLSLFPPMTVDTLRGEKPVIAWHPQSSRPVAIATLSRHLASAEQLAATTVEFLEWCTHWRSTIRRHALTALHASPDAQHNGLVHRLALR